MRRVYECPVCRREFDARFAVFVASSPDPYDTIGCARRATIAAAGALAAPILLPTIDIVAFSAKAAPPLRCRPDADLQRRLQYR